MIKKIIFSALILASVNSFANNEIHAWKFATTNDGLFQLLGPDDKKKFVVTVEEFFNNKSADEIIVNCNAGNGMYERHTVKAKQTITCYPHFHDTVEMYISPEQFKNGSQGSFRYEVYEADKK